LIDAQRSTVLAAIEAVASGTRPTPTQDVLRGAMERAGRLVPLTAAQRFEVSRKRLAAPVEARVIDSLHAAAHLAVDPVFPPHGAEFCAALLRAAEGEDRQLAANLRAEFNRRGVHYNADHRRRAAMRSVLQRAGDGTREVEVVADDPPERLVGRFGGYRRGLDVVVDGTSVPLARLRYFGRVS